MYFGGPNDMEIKSLNCPNCNGHLEIEDGIDTFFCKYCGNKILLAGQSDAAYQAKTKIKEFEHEEAMKESKFKNDQAEWERKEKTKNREHKQSIKYLFLMFVPILLMMLYFLPQKLEHNSEIKELEKTSYEIELAMSEGDYDRALLLANRLRISDSYSRDDAEKWDAQREEYIRQIREAQKKNGDYVFIYAPIDSDKCSDYTKSEMYELFGTAGFKNITTEAVNGSAGFFSRSNTVKSVAIDGKDTFSTQDTFLEEAEVVITYFEK